MKPDINRLLELQKLLLSFSQVERTIHRKQSGKYILENDTEHSYNLAMTAWFLAKWFPELDKDLVIRYALAHDMVEVHAGDTYIYGSEAELSSKKSREADALKQLATDWQDFDDMNQTIEAYEKRQDPESRFVYALDKIMPIMLIYLHDGYSWEKSGVTADMLYQAKISKVEESQEILPYFEALHKLLLSRPDVIKRK